MNDRTPPHSVEAEQSVIGAVLLDAKAWGAVSHLLTGPDFYRPVHEAIWNAVKNLYARGAPVDLTSVSVELGDSLERAGGMLYLFELTQGVVSVNAEHHAGIVRERSVQRKHIEECTRNLQDAWEGDDPIETKIEKAEKRLRLVPVSAPDEELTVMTLDEFCDQPVPPNDWIIPDLIDRGDRLILTGGEGLGKSILMRQFAVAVAAGFHPFTYRPMEPRSVLYVDAENPKKIMIKTFGEMREAVRRKRGPFNERRLWIERRPAGLNLGDPGDRLWLQRLATLVNPDLLCIGPAYKLYRGSQGDKDEDLARQVTSALDSVRESVNCALILEHHSPHGDGQSRDVRPFGSSLWMRWPEFGYGIRAAKGATKKDRLVDFIGWRGPRDERSWPNQLAAGTDFMPWMDAEYT